jgi:hypothetical protein
LTGESYLDATREEGNRAVLILESLFMALLEELSDRTGKDYTVDWGDPITSTHTFFHPTIYESEEPDAGDGSP